jgi:hypothetical protein
MPAAADILFHIFLKKSALDDILILDKKCYFAEKLYAISGTLP